VYRIYKKWEGSVLRLDWPGIIELLRLSFEDRFLIKRQLQSQLVNWVLFGFVIFVYRFGNVNIMRVVGSYPNLPTITPYFRTASASSPAMSCPVKYSLIFGNSGHGIMQAPWLFWLDKWQTVQTSLIPTSYNSTRGCSIAWLLSLNFFHSLTTMIEGGNFLHKSSWKLNNYVQISVSCS